MVFLWLANRQITFKHHKELTGLKKKEKKCAVQKNNVAL